jgi:hypothetical protein
MKQQNSIANNNDKERIERGKVTKSECPSINHKDNDDDNEDND